MKNKMFVIQIITVAVGVLGMIMLISGIVLSRLDAASRKTPDIAQMPEEYIQEFLSDEGRGPDIEDHIEPAYDRGLDANGQ